MPFSRNVWVYVNMIMRNSEQVVNVKSPNSISQGLRCSHTCRRCSQWLFITCDVIKWKHFHVTGHLCGEFTGPGEFSAQRPVARSFGVFFDLRLNKRLSKQSWGWWLETLSCPLWRYRNEENIMYSYPTIRTKSSLSDNLAKNNSWAVGYITMNK